MKKENYENKKITKKNKEKKKITVPSRLKQVSSNLYNARIDAY